MTQGPDTEKAMEDGYYDESDPAASGEYQGGGGEPEDDFGQQVNDILCMKI